MALPSLPELYAAVWGLLEGDDVTRWFGEGFALSSSNTVPFALQQHAGGPCGILAAVQAFTVARLLFKAELPGLLDGLFSLGDGPTESLLQTLVLPATGGASSTSAVLQSLQLPSEVLDDALAHALSFTIWQAASQGNGGRHTRNPSPVAVVVVAQPGALPLSPASLAAPPAGPPQLVPSAFTDFASVYACVRDPHVWPQWGSPSGVVLLLLSALASRGLERVRADSDEPTPLVARFGQGSQELLNLFLVGAAVSNVFDGTQRLGASGDMEISGPSSPGAPGIGGGGDGDSESVFCMRGIPRRPVVGYLSAIESLRYTKVGSFLKAPLLPLWIVGSESHFTLVFGCDPAVNEESADAGVRRAFSRYDAHDAGFIEGSRLREVLCDVGLPHIAADPDALAQLSAQLDTSGAGVVVFTEFYAAVRPLLESLRPQPQPLGAAAGASGNGAGAAGMDVLASAAASDAASPAAARAATVPAAPSVSAPAAPTTAATAQQAPPDAPSMEAALRAGFERAEATDSFGAGCGFIPMAAARRIAHEAMRLPPPPGGPLASPPPSEPATSWPSKLWRAMSSIATPPTDPGAVAMWDDCAAHFGPLLRERAAEMGREQAAAAAAAAAAHAAVGASASGVRSRSDSDIAREMQAQWAMEEEHPVPVPALATPAVAGAGHVTGSGAPLFAPIDLSAITGTRGRTGSFGDELPPLLAIPANAPQTGAFASPATAAPAAGGPPSGGDRLRCFELFHLNGLVDRGRPPRCVRLVLRQSDSGLPPGLADLPPHAAGGGGMDVDVEEEAAAGVGAGGGTDTASNGSNGSLSSGAAAEAASRRAREREKAVDALEAVLRTKWPGVAVAFEGPEVPSLN